MKAAVRTKSVTEFNPMTAEARTSPHPSVWVTTGENDAVNDDVAPLFRNVATVSTR